MTQIHILSSDEPLLKNDRAAVLLDEARRLLPQAELMLITAQDLKSRGLAALENELRDPGLFGKEHIIRIYLERQASRRSNSSYDFEGPALDILNLLVATACSSNAVVLLDIPRLNYSYSRIAAVTPNTSHLQDFAKIQKKKSASTQKKEAIAALRGLGATLEFFYPPEGQDLGRFVRERAARYGLAPDSAALDYLCAAGEGNLYVIDQTLQLLQSTLPHDLLSSASKRRLQTVTVEDIVPICASDSRFGIFDFADALCMGHSHRALNILSALCRGGSTGSCEALVGVVNHVSLTLDLIAHARAAALRSPRDIRTYFANHGVRLRSSQEALARAALQFDDALLSGLNQLAVQAASALTAYRFAHGLAALQSMAVYITRQQALALQAPDRYWE